MTAPLDAPITSPLHSFTLSNKNILELRLFPLDRPRVPGNRGGVGFPQHPTTIFHSQLGAGVFLLYV